MECFFTPIAIVVIITLINSITREAASPQAPAKAGASGYLSSAENNIVGRYFSEDNDGGRVRHTLSASPPSSMYKVSFHSVRKILKAHPTATSVKPRTPVLELSQQHQHTADERHFIMANLIHSRH